MLPLLQAYLTGNVRINVKFRRVSPTIVTVEKQKILHILSACL